MCNKKRSTSKTQQVFLEKSSSKYCIIPYFILLDVRLSPLDRWVYGIINSISSSKSGFCTMSNSVIAELMNSSRESISKSISKLVELGFISRVIIRGQNNRYPIGRKLWQKDNVKCVFNEKTSVDTLTIKPTARKSDSVEKAPFPVSKKAPNTKEYIRSYNIDKLETIDTLDFID